MTEKFIPLSIPNLKGNELNYVTKAIKEEWVSTGGAEIQKLEENFAKYLNVDLTCAIQSGTAGLHLAMILSNVGYNDEVIVPTLTFIAAINPVKYCGAHPVFMDCDDNLCIDVEKVESFIENNCEFKNGKLINKSSKRHIKAIIAVHVFGAMADIDALVKMGQKYNLKIIEDATEALGTYEKSTHRHLGTIGDFGVYSFNGNKIITTGGGGLMVAKNPDDLKQAKYLSTQSKDDMLYFIHNEIGYNYRMTNLQAALGLAQLERLEEFVEIKNKNYEKYINADLNLLPFDDKIRSNKWFYSLITNKRDELIKYMAENKVQTRPIWKLIHTLKPYQDCESYKIEKALKYYDKIVNIPCSTNLEDEDIKRVVQLIKGYIA